MNKRYILIFLMSIALLKAEEPSAFGAGDLNSPNPYGLTPSEKIILKNKKEVKNLSTNVGFVKTELNDMQEKIDGIKSVVESQNNRIYKIEQKIAELQEKDNNITQQLSKLREDLNITIDTQKKNYNKIKLVLSELSSLIDSINRSYVSKKMLQNRLSLSKKKISSKNSTSKSVKILFRDAKNAYFKKEYAKAKDFFKKCLSRKYMPATSSFYLGEIEYYTKNYTKAIEWYKKSISLYDKAKFTPTLLLHTYLSLKKIGDKKSAENFKKILLQKYPNSKEAKVAKKANLNLL